MGKQAHTVGCFRGIAPGCENDVFANRVGGGAQRVCRGGSMPVSVNVHVSEVEAEPALHESACVALDRAASRRDDRVAGGGRKVEVVVRLSARRSGYATRLKPRRRGLITREPLQSE
jgi:hypothetical protein